jgi:hypothetical protein
MQSYMSVSAMLPVNCQLNLTSDVTCSYQYAYCCRRAPVNGCQRLLILIFLNSHIKMLMNLRQACSCDRTLAAVCCLLYGSCSTDAINFDAITSLSADRRHPEVLLWTASIYLESDIQNYWRYVSPLLCVCGCAGVLACLSVSVCPLREWVAHDAWKMAPQGLCCELSTAPAATLDDEIFTSKCISSKKTLCDGQRCKLPA